MKRELFALAGIMIAAVGVADAADKYDPFTPLRSARHNFAAEPKTNDITGKNVMLKPEGSGPFPALVLMPTCSNAVNKSVWVTAALNDGYVVVVIDPMTSRHISNNCSGRPLPLPFGRQLKDAFDAAELLRGQSFVDPSHIGLMGFSQGGMVGLATAGSTYSQAGGRKPFAAVVSLYPICVLENRQHPFEDRKVDIVLVPDKFVVPILVEMGDQDIESGEPMNGCPSMLDEHKAMKEPIDYKIYHAGHIWDFHISNEVTEQSARDAFAFLDAHLKAP